MFPATSPDTLPGTLTDTISWSAFISTAYIRELIFFKAENGNDYHWKGTKNENLLKIKYDILIEILFPSRTQMMCRKESSWFLVCMWVNYLCDVLFM